MLQSSRGPQVLLSSQVASGAVPVLGAAYRLRPVVGDGVVDDAQVFTFVAKTQFNGGATTPTGQVVIEGSADNATWYPIANGTVRTSDNSIAAEQVPEVTNMRIPPYIRAKTVLAGGTAPTLANVTVWVNSNADFSLEAA